MKKIRLVVFCILMISELVFAQAEPSLPSPASYQLLNAPVRVGVGKEVFIGVIFDINNFGYTTTYKLILTQPSGFLLPGQVVEIKKSLEHGDSTFKVEFSGITICSGETTYNSGEPSEYTTQLATIARHLDLWAENLHRSSSELNAAHLAGNEVDIKNKQREYDRVLLKITEAHSAAIPELLAQARAKMPLNIQFSLPPADPANVLDDVITHSVVIESGGAVTFLIVTDSSGKESRHLVISSTINVSKTGSRSTHLVVLATEAPTYGIPSAVKIALKEVEMRFDLDYRITFTDLNPLVTVNGFDLSRASGVYIDEIHSLEWHLNQIVSRSTGFEFRSVYDLTTRVQSAITLVKRVRKTEADRAARLRQGRKE